MDDPLYEAKITIAAKFGPELEWWERNIGRAVGRIKSTNFDVVIHTDASNSGWGATDRIFGFWNEFKKDMHIHLNELLVVKIALERLADELRDCQILLLVDNTTAISYINKMGGVRLSRHD